MHKLFHLAWIPSVMLIGVLSYSPTSAALDDTDDGTCQSIAGRDISPPRISVFRVKERAPESEGMFRISGSIEGVCISEAGYFEKGIKKQPIATSKTRSFRRFEFEIEARLEDKPEIHATNVTGETESIPVRAAKSEAEWQETYQERYHDLRTQ